MVVIDTKLNKAYEGLTKAAVADLIGVHRNTIGNWAQSGVEREEYHHFIVYFNTDTINTRRGKRPDFRRP